MLPTPAPRLSPEQALQQAQIAALMSGGQAPVDPWAAIMGTPAPEQQVAAGPPVSRAGLDAYEQARLQSTIPQPGQQIAPAAAPQQGAMSQTGFANAGTREQILQQDAIKAEKLRQMMIKRGDIKK
jgi:hypothetical protein